MKVFILTLFPDELKLFFLKGIVKRAFERGLFDIQFINIRDFSPFKYKNVDDYPFGQKSGMVIRADILHDAITSIEHWEQYRIIYTCPKGKPFHQSTAKTVASEKGLIIISGYYEGVDERIFEKFKISRVSMGDFVLSSGELPALMITEAVVRLIPGFIKPKSVNEDSIISGLLEHPYYTQPREWGNDKVPEVIVSGNHKAIQTWQRMASLRETLYQRIDLLNQFTVSKEDQQFLTTMLKEEN